MNNSYYYWRLSRNGTTVTLHWYGCPAEVFTLQQLESTLRDAKTMRYLSKSNKQIKVKCLEEGIQLLKDCSYFNIKEEKHE